ncbi:MAG: hypothetical protein U9O53_03480, partial [archaeon]|nr:hypothetical protein [archaeon]
PIQTSSATYTFYANAESGIKDYSLIIKNNNGGNLNDVFLNFSSLNFTKGSENITITLTKGTDGVTVDENNATFDAIGIGQNESVILSFNVSDHTDGTYSTTFDLTSSNGQPISNYSVTLELVIDSGLDISMTHPSVDKLYPGNTTTFELDVSYRDGTPVTSMNLSNISALTILYGTSSASILSSLNNFTEEPSGSGTYLLNLTLPAAMVGGNLSLGITISADNYAGSKDKDIQVYSPHLSSPAWTSGKSPADIDIYTFGTGYDIYGITIVNNGLEPSGTLTATLETCDSSYLKIFGDAAKTISSIPAGGTGTVSWEVDPIANKSSCAVTVSVTGGKFWFNATSASSPPETIKLTSSQPTVVNDDETTENTPQTLSTCDVSMCDYDEKCVNGVCTYIECDDGYHSNHKCIKYDYSIDFTSVPEDMEIVQGNSSSIRINYKNTGNMKIENFNFTLDGMGNGSSYKIVTDLPDKILDDEPQDVVIYLNISSDAQIGQYNITVWFNSDELDNSTTFVLSVLPDEESIAEIEGCLPEIEKNITRLKKEFDKIKDNINGTNYTLLNETLCKIDQLYDEMKNATLSGDFLTAYGKKAEIEELIIQAEVMMSGTESLNNGGSFKYLLLAFILLMLSAGGYIFYDNSRPDGYHIFRGLSLSHMKQMRLSPFFASTKKSYSLKTGKPIYKANTNFSNYHYKPTLEVKFLRALHSLRHRINLKFENMQSHQTKLDNRTFAPKPKSYALPVRTGQVPSYASNNKPDPKTQVKPAQSPKPEVKTVSKMMNSLERSKTRCGLCGKNFKNVYELALHKKYSHKSLNRK